MRSSQPPGVASWILERFAVLDNYAALSGDLTEEYRSGRSAGWYWRQVLVAILVGVWKEILDHKLLTIRAIATGWFVEYWIYFPFGGHYRRSTFVISIFGNIGISLLGL